MRPTRSASKTRNVLEERQKAGMLWVAPVGDRCSTRSRHEISWWKTQQTKNSLNFVSGCLKVVDTRGFGQHSTHFPSVPPRRCRSFSLRHSATGSVCSHHAGVHM